MQNLNFPYYTYPGIPFAGYSDMDAYNSELIRLYDSLLEITKMDPIIFHLTIGAAAEEYENTMGDQTYDFQWQQLFPHHLMYFLKNNNKNRKVIHYIVAPNNNFGKNDYIPHFIKKTPEFNWQISNNTFISKNYNYEVHVFYTMMPTNDANNKKIIDRILMKVLDRQFSSHTDIVKKMEEYRQSDYDKHFVEEFYKRLDFVIKSLTENNSLVSCFSFAVFNKKTANSSLDNFSMFPEIKKIYNKPMCFLGEWIFVLANYALNLSNDEEILKKYGKKINPTQHFLSYVSPELPEYKNMKDGYRLYVNVDDFGMLKIILSI